MRFTIKRTYETLIAHQSLDRTLDVGRGSVRAGRDGG